MEYVHYMWTFMVSYAHGEQTGCEPVGEVRLLSSPMAW